MQKSFFIVRVALAASLFPLFVGAASIPAGFASHPIWLSKQSAGDGDSVRIFTVVYNSATSSVTGTVHYLVDGKDIGTSNVSLNAGETKVQSLAWRATAGSHTLQAAFANPSLPLDYATTDSVSISVTSPLPPPAYIQAMQSAAQTASAVAASTTPIISNITNNIVTTSEALRNAGENYIDDTLASDTAPTTLAAKKLKRGSVLGTSTIATQASNAFDATKIAAEQAGKKVFGSAVLFYPIVAALFFLILYWLTRGIKKPGK